MLTFIRIFAPKFPQGGKSSPILPKIGRGFSQADAQESLEYEL